MTPKIDYELLATAIAKYRKRGYEMVSVPWIVPGDNIRATLPEDYDTFEIGIRGRSDFDCDVLAPLDTSYLIGSAEQGFLGMGLKPGKYMAVTPCFRNEALHDMFYQDTFMKLELHDTRENAAVGLLVGDAEEVMLEINMACGLLFRHEQLEIVHTDEGTDLNLAGIEVGSYGKRHHPFFGTWFYGTGLALPRFSVAAAMASVL